MICFEGESADAVWRQAALTLSLNGSLQPSRDQTTRTVYHVLTCIAAIVSGLKPVESLYQPLKRMACGGLKPQ